MKRLYVDENFQRCYEAGYNCAKYGASFERCNGFYFKSPDRTAAWIKGHKEGLKKRK